MTHISVEELDISEFRPTQRQLLAKTKLHTFVPAHIIGGLTPETLTSLRGYLFPVSVDEILRWHLESRIFWFWFVIQNEQVTRLHSMKGSAVEAISNILHGDVLDSKLAGIQLKAAQLLLNLTDKATTSVTQNTMHISSGSDLPKTLRKKSNVELQEELKRLEAKMDPED
jgi:hypothetical protein